jgi:hypothetical protein
MDTWLQTVCGTGLGALVLGVGTWCCGGCKGGPQGLCKELRKQCNCESVDEKEEEEEEEKEKETGSGQEAPPAASPGGAASAHGVQQDEESQAAKSETVQLLADGLASDAAAAAAAQKSGSCCSRLFCCCGRPEYENPEYGKLDSKGLERRSKKKTTGHKPLATEEDDDTQQDAAELGVGRDKALMQLERTVSASSAGTLDSFKMGMKRIASCRSVLKMDVHVIPEGSAEREEFKKDFAKEMALALSYLVVQKLDAQGVKALKDVAVEAEAAA